ncbi:hypothetical protein [Arthrobacter sp. H20]|uniref:hypothetical protein n=1 Tax=Arthrobacter sp. H20 TaxID=1267981 RepID=UPI0004B9E330|nr:hypothetical protein [Arthrobacter sp. H20]
MAIDNSALSPTRGITGTRTGSRRRLALILAVLLLIVGSWTYGLLMGKETHSVPLGASAPIEGGLGRINGIIPLESDKWMPPGGARELGRPGPEGSHRVRVLLELTALEPGGVDFAADEYIVAGVGTRPYDVMWAEVESASLAQGETLTAVLVFELPDQAVLLTLENDDGASLSLGTGHHSGAQ